MQPVAPYREGGKASGLPFPRKSIGVWSAVTIAAAVLAAILPICLLASRPTNIVGAMKDGGLAMLGLLLLQFVVPVIVTTLGVLAIRGRKISPSSLAFVALVPSLFGLVFSAYSHETLVRALSGEGVDLGERLRIADLGLAEATMPLLYGALVSAFALFVVAIAATGIVASVDRARVGAPAGIAWLVSLVVSLAFIVASIAYAARARAFDRAPLVFAFSVGAAMVIAILAALASHFAACLRGWHDPKESSQMAGAILVAALASALVLVSFDRAILLSVEHHVFRALSGQSVEPDLRVRFIHEWFATSHAFAVIAAMHIALVLGAFTPALIRASGGGTSPFSRSTLLVLVSAVIVPASFVAWTANQHAYIREVAAATRTPEDPVTLPNVGTLRAGAFSQRNHIVVRSDTTLMFSPPSTSLEEHSFAVDKDVIMATLINLTPTPASPGSAPRYRSGVRETHFLVDAVEANNASSSWRDPEIAAIMGELRPALGAVVDWNAYDETSLPSIVIGADNKLLVTARYTHAEAVFSVGADLPERLADFAETRKYTTSFYVIVQPTTTMDTLAHVIAAVQKDAYHEVYLSVARPH